MVLSSLLVARGGPRVAALTRRAVFLGTSAFAYRHVGSSAAAAASAGAASAHTGEPPPAVPLHFVSELTYLPSPEKITRGSKGEDAYFVSRHAVGVADGVGGWSDVGVDAGEYSRALMSGTKEWAEDAVWAAEDGDAAVFLDPLAALQAGFDGATPRGSSTACVATIGHDGNLRVINVGDSGLQVWRHNRPVSLLPPHKLRLDEAAKLWSSHLRTTEQQHYFNCPYQLEVGGDDVPSKGQLLTFAPLPGDLVLLGTDGLFDNLFEGDIRAVLAKIDFTPCHTFVRAAKRRYASAASDGSAPNSFSRVERIVGGKEDVHSDAAMAVLEKGCRSVLLTVSAALAVSAQRVGLDPTAKTPFSAGARAAGLQHSGGKLDDVVALAAIVVPDDRAPFRMVSKE